MHVNGFKWFQEISRFNKGLIKSHNKDSYEG